ncbi:hypothetical protein GCM10010420_32010 [Streptomyces glaucosporus]|uniref:Uncharacterized protein n=1 Tax=Streptomyces glaucosporus TaxID=284044 RepID=A0ABP5VGA2_9ACTN
MSAGPAGRHAHRTDACRTDGTSVPGVRALSEDRPLTPDGTGTRARYTAAAGGTALFRAVLRLIGPGTGHSFRGAVRAPARRTGPGRRAQERGTRRSHALWRTGGDGCRLHGGAPGGGGTEDGPAVAPGRR